MWVKSIGFEIVLLGFKIWVYNFLVFVILIDFLIFVSYGLFIYEIDNILVVMVCDFFVRR